MKRIISTAVLTLFLGISSVFAQSTVAPEEGAVRIGSFMFDLNMLSAPQPDIKYSTSADNGAVETTVWMTSGGEVEVTVNADPVPEWKQNDPIYHDATMEYTYNVLGANAVWLAIELGYNVGEKSIAHMVEYMQINPAERNYAIDYSGSEHEVYLVTDSGTY